MTAVFDAYGHYYDLLYAEKDYQSETEWVRKKINTHRPLAKTILELGCGTGAHAAALAKSGFLVHGVDQSESMLALAHLRARSIPSDIQHRLDFSTGDIRSIRKEEKYDIALSLFHVFSYLTSNDDLQKAFETAAAHLEPDGLLIFDFWFGPAVLGIQPETRVKRLTDSQCRITRIAEPDHDSTTNTVTVRYSMFVEQLANGNIQQLTEYHRMRYLFLPELDALSSPWFAPLEWKAWLEDRQPSAENWAACAIMQKK